jgi:hypothetical protein
LLQAGYSDLISSPQLFGAAMLPRRISLLLSDIGERLNFMAVRLVLKMMPKLGFPQGMEDALAAAKNGDWDAMGHIRRAHTTKTDGKMPRLTKVFDMDRPSIGKSAV